MLKVWSKIPEKPLNNYYFQNKILAMQNHGVTNGLYLGLITVAYTLLFYFISTDLLFKWWLLLVIGLGLTIFFMRKAGIDTRTDLGGAISFREALKPTFLTLVVGALIGTIFTYLLYNVIDPGLIDVAKEYTLAATEKMVGMFGGDDAAVEQARAAIEEKDFAKNYSIRRLGLGYLVNLVIGFIIAAIISAVIKRNPPEDLSMD